MSFSVSAATSFVPLMSRVVLCLAFVSAGYNKVFNEAEFTDLEANQLQSLGVKTTMPAASASVGERAGGMSMVYASYRQETPQEEPDVVDDQNQAEPQPQTQPEVKPDPAPEPKPEQPSTGPRRILRRPGVTPATKPAATAPAETPAVRAEPPAPKPAPPPPVVKPAESEEVPAFAEPNPVEVTSGGSHRAPGMYKVALMVDNAGWPAPVRMAQVAAFTELIGGALLLVGLFSRLWGLGLAIAMGAAFYLVSMQMNGALSTHPFDFAQNVPAFNTMYCQLGLFVMAFGIFLTGGGALSLDRLLFGRRSHQIIDETMM